MKNMIQEVGLSGMRDIIWEEEYLMKIKDK
jgi:hypothetical protein